jgi:hypothetical protein
MPDINIGKRNIKKGTVESLGERRFDLSKFPAKNKRLLLRNCVEPELGKHILDWSQKEWHHTQSLSL